MQEVKYIPLSLEGIDNEQGQVALKVTEEELTSLLSSKSTQADKRLAQLCIRAFCSFWHERLNRLLITMEIMSPFCIHILVDDSNILHLSPLDLSQPTIAKFIFPECSTPLNPSKIRRARVGSWAESTLGASTKRCSNCAKRVDDYIEAKTQLWDPFMSPNEVFLIEESAAQSLASQIEVREIKNIIEKAYWDYLGGICDWLIVALQEGGQTKVAGLLEKEDIHAAQVFQSRYNQLSRGFWAKMLLYHEKEAIYHPNTKSAWIRELISVLSAMP